MVTPVFTNQLFQDRYYLFLDIELDCIAGTHCDYPRRQLFFAGSPLNVEYYLPYKTMTLEIYPVGSNQLHVRRVDHYTKPPYGINISDITKEYTFIKQL